METHTRTLDLDLRAADDKERRIPATLSTEFPVARNGFNEILVHEPGSIDLTREPLPLIEVHDSHKVNIGLVEDLRIVGRKLRGMVRFGKSQRGRELFDDVKDKIVRNLSIGYEWLGPGERDGDDIRVLSWMPLEVSIVPVPADPHAGFFRGNSMETNEAGGHKTRSEKRAENRNQAEELERISAIQKTRDQYVQRFPDLNEVASNAIDQGWPTEAFTQVIREKVIANSPGPVAACIDDMGGGYADPRSIISRARDSDLDMNRETRDRVLRAFGRNRQVAEARAHVAGRWFCATMLGDKRSERWLMDGGYSTRAMGGSINSKGGALVPEELSAAVIDLRDSFGIFRQHARLETMSSDTRSVPRRTGRVQGQWLGENEQMTDSDGSWDNVNLVARKLGALTRMSSEVSEDAVIDLAMHLANEFAVSFAEAEDDAGFNGDGTSTYGGIQGIRTKLIDGTHTAGAVDATTGDDTIPEVIAADLDALMGQLPNFALPGAAWFCSQLFNQRVFQAIARAAGGVTMVEHGTVRVPSYGGYPIIISEKLPNSATTSYDAEVMVLFGNLRLAAMLGDRRGFRFQVLEERYADFDQIGVKATERLDIVVNDLGDNTTAGPIVGLVGNA